jgi:hypothetical protein
MVRRGVTRYAALAAHLAAQPGPYWEVTLAEIAAVLGLDRLPEVAYRRGHWWHNVHEHRQAREGWLATGWRVADVDRAAGVVTFVQEGR